VAHHKTNVSELDGIGRRMPFTMSAFAIASLSMIGLPPTAGIVSKWWLADGAAAGHRWGILAVLLVSTILNAAYFLPIVWRAFFRRSPEGAAGGIREAPWTSVLALSLTAVGTLLLFLFPDFLIHLAQTVVHAAGGRP
jgi:multicomponent Na+:H+ antiporter subunit D